MDKTTEASEESGATSAATSAASLAATPSSEKDFQTPPQFPTAQQFIEENWNEAEQIKMILDDLKEAVQQGSCGAEITRDVHPSIIRMLEKAGYKIDTSGPFLLISIRHLLKHK